MKYLIMTEQHKANIVICTPLFIDFKNCSLWPQRSGQMTDFAPKIYDQHWNFYVVFHNYN